MAFIKGQWWPQAPLPISLIIAWKPILDFHSYYEKLDKLHTVLQWYTMDIHYLYILYNVFGTHGASAGNVPQSTLESEPEQKKTSLCMKCTRKKPEGGISISQVLLLFRCMRSHFFFLSRFFWEHSEMYVCVPKIATALVAEPWQQHLSLWTGSVVCTTIKKRFMGHVVDKRKSGDKWRDNRDVSGEGFIVKRWKHTNEFRWAVEIWASDCEILLWQSSIRNGLWYSHLLPLLCTNTTFLYRY